jgi:Abnormal spindle-like microcephaly-assoc'd, ASPM-SPD-2-Hydin
VALCAALFATAGSAHAALVVTPEDDLEFGERFVGQRHPLPVEVRNTGADPVTIDAVFVDDGDAFDWDDDTCTGATLEQDESCGFSAVFRPRAAGEFDDVLVVRSDAPDSPHLRVLRGSAVQRPPPPPPPPPGRVSVDPTTLDFGGVVAGTTGGSRTVTVENVGVAATRVRTHISASAPGFSARPKCGTLAPGARCVVDVFFRPRVVGRYGATLSFRPQRGQPVTVSLTGEGLPRPARTPVEPQIATQLRDLLRGKARRWSRAGHRALLRRGFRLGSLELPAGTVRLDVRVASKAGAAASLLVARGRKVVSAPSRIQLRGRLTRRGRRLLRARRPVRLVATLTFRALDGQRSQARAVIRLRR